MQVVATKQGYDGLVVREPGETFEMPEGSTSTWFAPPDEAKAARGRGRGRARPAEEDPPPDEAKAA